MTRNKRLGRKISKQIARRKVARCNHTGLRLGPGETFHVAGSAFGLSMFPPGKVLVIENASLDAIYIRFGGRRP